MHRKIMVSIIILLSWVSTVYAAEGIKWVYPLSTAERRAKEEGKLLMVVVYTRWNSASRRLERQTFEDEKVIELSRQFVGTQVGISNQAFLKRYKIARQPTTIFLKGGKEIASEWLEVDRIPGFVPPEIFKEKMLTVLEGKKTYLAMKLRMAKEPGNVENIKELAGKYVEQDRISVAIGLYERLARLDAKRKDKYLAEKEYLKASLLMRKGKIDEARTKFKSLLSKYPESESAVKSRFGLITCLLMKNQLDEALISLKSFLKQYPNHELAPEASYLLGQIYIRKGEGQKGTNILRAAIGKYSGDKRAPFLLYALGEYYLRSGQVKEAKEIFNRLVEKYPHNNSGEEAKRILRTIKLWPGRREALRQRKKVKDIVYLVPDVGTFLYYLSKWDRNTIFPILMADLKFSKKFLKKFQPSQIVLADSVPVGEVNKELIYRALYASWGPEDIFQVKKVSREDLKKRLGNLSALPVQAGRKLLPIGIVLTRAGADTLPGGLALAAGRNQLLDFLPFSYRYGRTISFSQMQELRVQIKELIASWGYDYESLLQGIDYITLSADLAYAYRYTETIDPGRYAVDDALGRDDNGERYAYVGRLLGSEEQSLFQAMSSLFLQPEKALFFNTYSVNSLPWRNYEMKSASRLLGKFIPTKNIQAEATIKKWREIMSAGNSYGLVFVNSSGGRDNWSTRQGRGATEDIPDSEPTIISFTHSGSAADPADIDTIAGRWLANGAYIYYGAVSEPYVTAFNPPSQVVGNILSGRTFSYSFRKKPGQQWSNPWRLWYLGDPLYHLEPNLGKRVGEEDSKKGLKAKIAKYLKKIEATEGGEKKALLKYKLALCYYYQDRLGKVIAALDGINPGNLNEKLKWEIEYLRLYTYYEQKNYLEVKRLFRKVLKERGTEFISEDLRLLVASSLKKASRTSPHSP